MAGAVTMRPLLYDLYCCAGGATRGYQEAGFEVIGVDVKRSPRYCGDGFVQMDALDFVRRVQAGEYRQPAAWHASPPCQTHVKGLAAVNASLGRTQHHADLIAATRSALETAGQPWVIENVEGASLRNAVRLCGSSFGLPIRRHRLFESPVLLFGIPCHHAWQSEPKYWTSWRPNGEHRLSTVVQVYGNGGNSAEWAAALDIDWMTRDELAEAIPPSYTEHIGRQLLAALSLERAS